MLFTIAGLMGSAWLGPEWAVSRYQDWHRDGKRIECVDRTLLARTAHFLPLRLNPKAAPVGSTATMRVQMELLAASDGAPWSLSREQWAGVLVGVGNEKIDYRLSSLVQQAPGIEGGTLVACSGSGEPRVVDFGHALVGENYIWSLPTKLDWDRLPRLDGENLPGGNELTPSPTAWRAPSTLILEIEITRGEASCDLVARTSLKGTEAVVSRVRGLPFEAVDGGIALCCSLVGAPAGIAYTVDTTRFSSQEWRDVDCDRAMGPVLACLYTLDRGTDSSDGELTLRLSAQFPPLDPTTISDLALWLGSPAPTHAGAVGGEQLQWSRVADATIEPMSCTARFEARLSNPLPTRYEVRCNSKQGEGAPVAIVYGGAIRAQAAPNEPAVLGALSCVKNMTRGGRWDHDGVWFPHADLVARVAAHDPDLLYFAGDQIYEGDISSADMVEARLDYLTKWHRFLWAFGPLTRDRPTICAPDDHDVFHGNLWGAGGRRAVAHDGLSAQDAGGYKLPAEIVNAVHRSQTGHHPPTRIAPTIEQGITTWTSRLVWGPFDCALVSDRMFKESASVAVPSAKVRNGFVTAESGSVVDAQAALCDPSVIAPLLGLEQETFLAKWADDPIASAPVRLVLSQSPFAGVQTLPTGKDDGILPTLEVLPQGAFYPDDVAIADTDSNGWPVAARDRAVALIKRAGALHVAGDQHLSSVVRYGHGPDDPLGFTVPAMANSFPRHWTPSHGIPEQQLRLTGDFNDGFGNAITVLAVANPARTDRTPRALSELSPGFALIRYEPSRHEVVLEAWPRVAPPAESSEADAPFMGWPLRVPLGIRANR